MRYIYAITYAQRELKTTKNMFPLCQTYKPTGARGLTSHVGSLANEVKIGHREPLVYATKN